MIRLLLVARPAAGGMAGHLRTLCTELSGKCCRVTVAAPQDSGWIPDRVPLICLPIADRIAPASDLRIAWRLRQLIYSGDYDLMHAHGLKAALLTALASAGRQRLPSVFTLHNTLPSEDTRWRERLLRWVLGTAKAVVVVSEAQGEDLKRRHLTPLERINTIPNGIALAPIDSAQETDRDEIRAGLDIAATDCLVLSVMRIMSAKGIGDLLAAARLLPSSSPLRFLIAGDGPERAHYTKLASSLGLASRLRFLGYRQDVPQLLQAADLFLLPSHAEGTPLSILEAMAAQRAVVATAVGGIPELVVDEETGLLIPPGEPSAIAAALSRLASNKTLRTRMGEAGRHRVEAHYTQEGMLTELICVYRNVLQLT